MKDKLLPGKFTSDKNLKYVLSGIFLSLVFLLLLLLNVKTPMIGDDFTYSLIFDTNLKIDGLSDIVTSQFTHYNIWGGRVIVHSIAQLLLFADPLTADVLNATCFVVLILLIYLHINIYKPFSLSLLVGIFLLVWFMEPIGETVLWITGSANYMWGTVILLAFLLPYRIYRIKRKTDAVFPAFLKTTGMLLLGIIAGGTNENVAAGMLFMGVLFILYYKQNGWKIPLWAISGLIGAIMGYIFMITAPGNFVRSAGVENGLFLLFYRLFRHTQALLNVIGILNLVLIILGVYIYKKHAEDYKTSFLLPLIYIAGVLISVYVMIFSPAFPLRAWFGVIIYNIIALGILLTSIQHPVMLKIKYACVFFGMLLFAFNLYDIYKDVDYVEKTMQAREVQIHTAIRDGQQSVILTPYRTSTKYAVEDAVYSAPLLSRYYGIEVGFSCE